MRRSLHAKNGEVDEGDDAGAEEEGVALEIAALELTEGVSDAGGEAASTFGDEAIDHEFIEEIRDGSEAIVEDSDDALVDFVEEEAAFKEGDTEAVFVSTCVEGEA